MEWPSWLDSTTKIWNWTKWYVKEILLLLQYSAMGDHPQVTLVRKLVQELYELSHKDSLNDPLYLFSRRQKAQVAKNEIEHLYLAKLLSDQEYHDIKQQLTAVLLENFSQQILPATTGIVLAGQQKTEQYCNFSKAVARQVLEPREYLGIVPEVASDLDAPSLVTALTPPVYEQPWHDHGENWEVTLYTWPSLGKYKTEGKEYQIEAQFGDVIIFPPKTWHTICNPTDYPVRNLSIKLPSALLDRGRTYMGASWKGEKRAMKETADHILTVDLSDLALPYHLTLYRFDVWKKEHTLQFDGKSLLYPLTGEYLVSTRFFSQRVLRNGDTVLLDSQEVATLQCLTNEGTIYCVDLKPDWREYLSDSL